MPLKGKRQVSKIRKPLRSWVQIIPHGPFLPAIEQGISLSPISDVSSVLCSSMNLVAMPKCSTSLQVSQHLSLENIEVTIVQALSRSNVMIEEMRIIMNLPLLMMIAYSLLLLSPVIGLILLNKLRLD